jgi:hypothetical protein
VEKSIKEAGKSVTEAGQMVRKPLDDAAKSAREALKPEADLLAAAVKGSESEPDPTEEAAVPPGSARDAAAAEQEQPLPAATPDKEEAEGADG